MNIHEYQAKTLLEQFKIIVPKGFCIEKVDEPLLNLIKSRLGSVDQVAIKAQIHAGGRGKGVFAENGTHGVQVVPVNQADAVVDNMLGKTLVTKQTGPEGKQVRKVYITEPVKIDREFYVSILIDRKQQRPVLIASACGGCNIEEVAQTQPENVVTVPIDPLIGLAGFQARQVAYTFNLTGEAHKECVQLLLQLYKAFKSLDASLIEINPLVLTQEGHMCALDAKIQLDDNALMRHPEYAALDDPFEKDPKEVEAARYQLNYIALKGNIACLVNGAGLAMATMDIIQHFGGMPANFLDVGGGAKQEQIEAAFKIILQDSHVKGIFINIFGGILQCDMLAKAIVAAAHSVQLRLPLVVRMKGTNVDAAKQILQSSGLSLIPIDDLAEATQTIVNKVQETSL